MEKFQTHNGDDECERKEYNWGVANCEGVASSDFLIFFFLSLHSFNKSKQK